MKPTVAEAAGETSREDFDALAVQHKDAVYNVLLQLCHNRADAEDILVEALLKAYECRRELRHPEAFQVWLSQIAKRIYWHTRRREALHPILELDSVPPSSSLFRSADTLPDECLWLEEIRALLNEALDALPASYREPYRLHEWEKLPVREIAARLGLSVANTKSRIHRARESVRHHLDVRFHMRGAI